jgi:hypothetical protein
MKNSLLKNLKKSEKAVFVFVALLVFFSVLYYIFFFIKAKPEGGLSTIAQDSYQEYKDYIGNTNKGVKALLENEQLKALEFNENDSNNGSFEKSDNPFVKNF